MEPRPTTGMVMAMRDHPPSPAHASAKNRERRNAFWTLYGFGLGMLLVGSLIIESQQRMGFFALAWLVLINPLVSIIALAVGVVWHGSLVRGGESKGRWLVVLLPIAGIVANIVTVVVVDSLSR